MLEDNRKEPVRHFPKHESLGETVDRVIENIGKRGTEPELKTGLEALDRGTLGLHKSQLAILAARPGQGKTSAAVQAAFNLACAGKKVAFVSLEMTRESLVEKMFCLENRVNSRKLMMNQLSADDNYKLGVFAKLAKELPIKIIDDYCFTERELFTLVEHLEMHPDVLIIDHIQHIRTEEAKYERETLNNYIRYLKEIAMRFEIAVLCLSQINRQGDDKPTLANLKSTGALEEMADSVIILHQKKDKTVFTDTNEGMIECVMDLAKNRRGPVGYFDVLFEAYTGRFLPMSHKKPEQETRDYNEN